MALYCALRKLLTHPLGDAINIHHVCCWLLPFVSYCYWCVCVTVNSFCSWYSVQYCHFTLPFMPLCCHSLQEH